MITIQIKTWRCSHCGYKQDFEPTQENLDKFFNMSWQRLSPHVNSNECIGCKKNGHICFLEKETDDSKKSSMVVYEKKDEEKIKNDYEFEGQVTRNGVPESQEERDKRISVQVGHLHEISEEELGKIKDKYEDK